MQYLNESYLVLLQAGVEAAEVEYEWFAGVAKNKNHKKIEIKV